MVPTPSIATPYDALPERMLRAAATSPPTVLPLAASRDINAVVAVAQRMPAPIVRGSPGYVRAQEVSLHHIPSRTLTFDVNTLVLVARDDVARRERSCRQPCSRSPRP